MQIKFESGILKPNDARRPRSEDEQFGDKYGPKQQKLSKKKWEYNHEPLLNPSEFAGAKGDRWSQRRKNTTKWATNGISSKIDNVDDVDEQ